MAASSYSSSSETNGSGTPSAVTLGEYLEEWLQIKEPTLSPTTMAWYTFVVFKHIIPEIGHLPINELTPRHLLKMYSDKLRPRPGGRKQLSQSSVRCIHRVLHAALSQAVRLQIIATNPCAAVDPPKSSRRAPRYWRPEEAARFLDAIRDDRLFALFHLALGTGLRRGELLGLRWECVDLERGCLTVNQVRVRAGSKTISKEPKTPGSSRTVALSKQVCETLRRHAESQNREKLLMGEAYTDNGLVFAGVDGRPLNPDYIGCQYFRRLVSRAGVPQINFHGLRHTHATLLAMGGVPLKTVSARLGHSSVKITGDIYSHVFDQMDHEAAQKFDAMLSWIPTAR
ncbi:MAG: tyrosine-type recombinase/integrase [Bacillota bacterium]